jgi:predicted NUDIX family phosphoesterase
MNETVTRTLGLLMAIAYGGFIVWLFASQPGTLAEVTGGVASSIGAYRVERQSFEEGLRFFREDKFAEARMALHRADPAQRDPTTQFYIAYAYYRQGWGRVYHDQRLFREGLATLDRAQSVAPGGRVVVDDPELGLQSADELRAELERGLARDLSTLDPRRLLRERQ